jgi:DNA polymerase elongation subunit (family B)
VKILLLDIETAPNTAYVWGLWKQNIPISSLVDSGYVMCWAAKWLGDNFTYFDSVHRSKPKQMLKNIHAMLEEADAVIHYNGSRFDIPTLNKEFLLHGMHPPASYAQIDLLRTVRSEFRFVSNKLDYIARALGVGQKTKHAGFELWIQCMANDPKAWEQMEEYNINDVVILEEVYHKLLPWIKNHPNHGVVDGETAVCPNCGSKHLQRRGYAYTTAGKYQRFQCKDCGTWSRGRKSEAVKNTNAKI